MTGPRLIVCMGVSGCGKSTVARAIADSLGASIETVAWVVLSYTL